MFKKPEIMSPAGYWPQLQAAIEAGADAVYFGLNHFTARAKVGFTLSELPEVMRTLHSRGVRGYITFNTLVFDHELRQAARALSAIAEAGADAIIVQDVGIARLAKQIAPELEVHGSTQMSITSAEGVELARSFGVSRVVLARELSFDDIRTIRSQTDCELEIFVHGALCVSYSGQCFSSEAWGGRSANRGQCAQACRMPYEMIVDGKLKPLGAARYLLSPGDMYTLNEIPQIVELGISSLKIEGRYKDSDYVALTTNAYRRAVDAAWEKRPSPITPRDEIQLKQVYSRGSGPYFISGTNHQEVVKGRAPRHRGVYMGRVVRVLKESVIIAPDAVNLHAPLKAGDGLVFDAADWRSPQEPEEGGRVYTVTPLSDGNLELRFGPGILDMKRIRAGDWVWRSDDPELAKVVRPFLESPAPVYKRPLAVAVRARVGQPLELTWTVVEHPELQVTVRSPEPLSAAQKRGLSEENLREQLGRLGNTAYYLAQLSLEQEGEVFVPNSLLNNLRREAVEQISELQAAAPKRQIADPEALLEQAYEHATSRQQTAPHSDQIQLHLLVRTPEQLDAALEMKPASITLDYLELYGLKPAVERVQQAGIEVRVASPRVLKPDEQRIVRFLLKLGCPIVVRSTGLLHALRQEQHPALIGDFSLNTANLLTADIFLDMGLERLTPTHDLNAAQISALAEGIGAEFLEPIAYQHLPVFHTEHCVFCRFLSEGTSFKNCGHPCEKHRVALRDERGRVHPVMADVGCRNTVFGAQAQEGSNYIDEWRAAGIKHIRLEFVHESAEEVRQVTRAFADYAEGRISSVGLGERLTRIAPQGTTEGSLFVPDGYLTIPLMS